MKLEGFVQKDDNLYNFRCPICGDSRKNKQKARGYVFEHKGKLVYKCHNCGATMPFSKFLEQEDSFLYSEYVLERFGKKHTKKEPTFKSSKPEFKITPKKEKVPDYLIPVSELSPEHIARKYISQRNISLRNELYFISNTILFEKTFDKYKGRLYNDNGRVVIPYRNANNKITGFTARALESNSSLRYINIKVSEEPMIWGLHSVDRKKPIFVVEGAFDAMLLDNAVAVSGSDLKKADKYFEKNRTFFIFDNEPRNVQICSKIEKMIQTDHKIFIPPKSLIGKDVNEMILNGLSSTDLKQIINNNSYSGLQAKLKFNQWKKI